MHTLGYDGFLDGVATVIAEHLITEDVMVAPAPHVQAEVVLPSSAVMPAHAFVLDHEKIVWHFPETASRIMEDPR